MKLNKKLSIGLTLTSMILLIGISAVFAAPEPVRLGTTPQDNPYDSNPLVLAALTGFDYATTPPTTGNERDGNLATQITGFWPEDPTYTFTEAIVESVGFEKPTVQWTPIGWVDIKMKYLADLTGYTDDTYRIEYAVGASAYTALQPDTSDNFDTNAAGPAAQIRSWAEVAEPVNGVWDWTDVGNLKVRIVFSAGADAVFDNVMLAGLGFNYFEVWAVVNKAPTPPMASPTMSVQPRNVPIQIGAPAFANRKVVFIEIYAQDVANLGGYQFTLNWNTSVLQNTVSQAAGTAHWSYYPFTDSAADVVNNATNPGTIEMSYTIRTDDPLYVAGGVTGNFALARIYFKVKSALTTPDPARAYTFFWFTVSFLGTTQAEKIGHTVYHGSYGTVPATKYLVGTHDLGRLNVPPPFDFPYTAPMSTEWIEQSPNPDAQWHLTSWVDNGDLQLSVSDQIDMTPTVPPGLVKWFHVDQIWGCDADPNTYLYMILTRKEVTPEFPLGIGILMTIVPAISIVYLWRTRPKKTQGGR